MLRWIVIIVLLAHGIGHVMGLFPALGLFSKELSATSWLLNRVLGETLARWFGFALFLAVMIGFTAAVLAIQGWLVPHDWWREVTIAAALLSIAAIVLYWDAFFTMGNKFGALAVDVAVLVALFWAQGPAEELLAAGS